MRDKIVLFSGVVEELENVREKVREGVTDVWICRYVFRKFVPHVTHK